MNGGAHPGSPAAPRTSGVVTLGASPMPQPATAIDPTGAPRRQSRVPAILFCTYVAWWLALAIAPSYRQDWLLENVLVLVALPLLIVGYRKAPFSDAAYVALFVFFALHAVGAHYTYSEVPYDAWASRLFGLTIGDTFGFERNHYDRLVHFLYGLLVAPAAVELIDRVSAPRGAWRWLLPLLFLVSHGAIYEIVEWGAAEVFGGDLGIAYLGTQGDVFDAQKDGALAALGACLALLVIRVRAARRTAAAA